MICIGFYCDMKSTSKTLVLWLVRTTLSMALYEIDVCMKLFNVASPKFDERGGTNMQSIEVAHGLHSVMASGPGDRRLYYKKKTIATKVTLEINLVSLGHHRHVLHVSKYLCGSFSLYASEVGLIERRVSLLVNCIKKIANRTFSTGRHLRRTPMPVWIHATCSVGDAAWSTSYFRSLDHSDCRMSKSW
jgi:hypothetical protein